MVHAGKKRNAKTQANPKPTKAAKKAEEIQDTKNNDLFDNLDEEMDPEEVESFMEQLDNDSEQQQESDNEKQESDDEEQENDNKIVEEEEDATMEESKQASVPSEQQNTARQFRDLYMSKVTQAFGSDLDQIRQEPTLNGPRLNILIDSLEAGIDIFSSLEQEIILADEQKIIK